MMYALVCKLTQAVYLQNRIKHSSLKMSHIYSALRIRRCMWRRFIAHIYLCCFQQSTCARRRGSGHPCRAWRSNPRRRTGRMPTFRDRRAGPVEKEAALGAGGRALHHRNLRPGRSVRHHAAHRRRTGRPGFACGHAGGVESAEWLWFGCYRNPIFKNLAKKIRVDGRPLDPSRTCSLLLTFAACADLAGAVGMLGNAKVGKRCRARRQAAVAPYFIGKYWDNGPGSRPCGWVRAQGFFDP